MQFAPRQRSSSVELFRGSVAAQPLDRLHLFASFSLDEQLATSPDYTGKKWRGFAGDIDQAFLAYQTGGATVLAGRFAQFWGDSESLFLSAKKGMDGLAYALAWGRFTLSYRIAGLNGENPDTDSASLFTNRYFAGHRLDIDLGKSIRLGLMETVIFGGPGRQIELAYLNPILFYHGSQLNEDVNDNTLIGFDLTCQPVPRSRLFAQLLLDDFQIDNEARGDKEPTEAAILLKCDVSELLPKTDLQLSYSRVTNWTFNQINPRNRYTQNGELLGAALGNDYDRTAFRLVRWLRNDLQSSFGLSHVRQGEGRVDAFWSEPWIYQTEGDYREPFPTGVVAHETQLSIGLKGKLAKPVFLDLVAGWEWDRNRGNVRGQHQTAPFVRLNLSLLGSIPLSIR